MVSLRCLCTEVWMSVCRNETKLSFIKRKCIFSVCNMSGLLTVICWSNVLIYVIIHWGILYHIYGFLRGVWRQGGWEPGCPFPAPPSCSPSTTSHYHLILLWQGAMLFEWVKAIKGHLFLTPSLNVSLFLFIHPFCISPHHHLLFFTDICLSYCKIPFSLFLSFYLSPFLPSFALLSLPPTHLLPFHLSFPPSLLRSFSIFHTVERLC